MKLVMSHVVKFSIISVISYENMALTVNTTLYMFFIKQIFKHTIEPMNSIHITLVVYGT